MTNETKELLAKCKEAGYTDVAVFMKHQDVPQTMKIKEGTWFGKWNLLPDPDVEILYEQYDHKVVCAHPEQKGKDGWPAMWSILKECGLLNGLFRGGCGMGDAHDINPALKKTLTAGYYSLES